MNVVNKKFSHEICDIKKFVPGYMLFNPLNQTYVRLTSYEKINAGHDRDLKEKNWLDETATAPSIECCSFLILY